VDFFGTPASTAEGAAMFAHRLNLPLLCTFSIRNNDALRTLRIEIAPAIFPDPTTERDADVLRLTQTHAKYLEDVVRRHPGSYFWLHRRWKTRPKNKRQKSVDE
jgi:KDO2-lipid IV(A) lauroyltransferase